METAFLLGSVSMLIILGIPVVYSLGIAAVATMVLTQSLSLTIVPQRMAAALDSFLIMAIPLFILMGNIMNHAGVTTRIFAFANALVGHIRGGLGHVNVVSSMIFAGMSGSGMADAAGLGLIEIKAMRDRGYPAPFAGALTAATSVIGPIIPPSIPMVIYGVMAEVSVGKLFAGGLLPGVVLGLSFMAFVYVAAHRYDLPPSTPSSLSEIVRAVAGGILPLLTVVLLVGGMLIGVFTPTEAAAAAVLYSLFLGVVVYREIPMSKLYLIFLESGKQSAMILVILTTASLFAWTITLQQVPAQFTALLAAVTDNKYVVLLIINLFLLVVGCFLDITSAMIITIPIFIPVIRHYGIDPVHFGVVMTLNLMLGGLTPPFAMLSFIVARMANISFESMVKATLPFFIPLLAVLLIVTYIPEVVMFLPNLFFR